MPKIAYTEIESVSFQLTGKNEARESRGTAITASAENSGYEARYAIDSDSRTEWRSDTNASYLVLTFPAATAIDRVFIHKSKDDDYQIGTVSIYYKVNITDAAWTVIPDCTNYALSNEGMVEFPTQYTIRQLKIVCNSDSATNYVGVSEIDACLQQYYFIKALGDGVETGNPSSMNMQAQIGEVMHTTGLPCKVKIGRGRRDTIPFSIPEIIGYEAVDRLEQWAESLDEVGVITDTGRIFFGIITSPSFVRNPSVPGYEETYGASFSLVCVR